MDSTNSTNKIGKKAMPRDGQSGKQEQRDPKREDMQVDAVRIVHVTRSGLPSAGRKKKRREKPVHAH